MVDNKNKMLAEIGPDFNKACIDYTKAAVNIVNTLARIGGLSKKAAANLATSKEMADTIALNLYSMTNQAVYELKKYKQNLTEKKGE